jgi:hypothetical protein
VPIAAVKYYPVREAKPDTKAPIKTADRDIQLLVKTTFLDDIAGWQVANEHWRSCLRLPTKYLDVKQCLPAQDKLFDSIRVAKDSHL